MFEHLMKKELDMKITVVDLNEKLIEEFEKQLNTLFANLKGSVDVKLGSFDSISSYDAIVSPGNSFGFMNGGVDNALREFFGTQLEQRVMDKIKEDYLGEHNVGSAFVIETKDSDYPWLVHAPTMRVPSVIAGSDAVYSATWAALVAVAKHNKTESQKIEHIVFPGMGTGAGKMKLDKAAGQMLLAFERMLNPNFSERWKSAYERNNKLRENV